MTSTSKIAACVLGVLFLCASTPGGARADNSDDYALLYAGAGLLLVNAGATVANGVALVADNPNRSNGMFGLVLGGATLGLSVIGFAVSDENDSSDDFALALGVCGVAAAVTGYLNVRAAGARASETTLGKKIVVYPFAKAHRAGAGVWGLAIEMKF
jgi:hypothetical protein